LKQHPVPQHISSYEFKLVGDMTLKQFFQLAGGAIAALIVYALPFPGYVKWPFILFFGALGAALAFLPIEERPLSTWIFAFLKAIYAPTKFSYNASTSEDVFAKSSNETLPTNPQAEQYLSKPAKSGLLESFETAERNFFNKVTTLFQTSGGHSVAPIPITQTEASPSQGRILSANQQESQSTNQQPNAFTQVPQPRAGFRVEEEVDIPQSQAIKAGHPNMPQVQTQVAPQTPQNDQAIRPVFSNQPAGDLSQTKQATFSQEAAPPLPPERPNTIVGQVLAMDGKIVDGAILEIKDSSKRPVRAIRSNKVGHFLTVTPLADGDYELSIEKEGYIFDSVQFKAEGKIIPPIQIKAKG
jgi:hypothetical protein